jgi:cytochrome c553
LIKFTFALSLLLFSTLLIAAPEDKTISAESCLACHSAPGLATNPLQPNLDGQPQTYLVSQLIAFQDSSRKHPKMNKRALALNKQEILKLASFFANRAPKKTTKKAKPLLIGNSRYNTCIGCHGISGEGRGNYPRLAGLSAAYISKQLKDYQNNQRDHGNMRSIAQTLSPQDVANLATYISAL